MHFYVSFRKDGPVIDFFVDFFTPARPADYVRPAETAASIGVRLFIYF